MIDFSSISNISFIGKSLRQALRIMPKPHQVRILQGPIRGSRWLIHSSNHGCWLGTYELAKQWQIGQFCRPGMVCFDIGANVGFFTLLFSKFVGPQGHVVAFEPLSSNCDLLERHVRMNSCRNVRIMPIAVSDCDGKASFAEAAHNSMCRLATDGEHTVVCARIDTLLRHGGLASPQLIKIDVEGAEVEVLRGAEQFLRTNTPVVFVATHGESQHNQCCDLLRDHGYSLRSVGGELISETTELIAVPA